SDSPPRQERSARISNDDFHSSVVGNDLETGKEKTGNRDREKLHRCTSRIAASLIPSGYHTRENGTSRRPVRCLGATAFQGAVKSPLQVFLEDEGTVVQLVSGGVDECDRSLLEP